MTRIDYMYYVLYPQLLIFVFTFKYLIWIYTVAHLEYICPGQNNFKAIPPPSN